MRNHKLIAVVGASDEETAHLRLLIRKAASQLQHAWRWGTELTADFVVVDPTVFAGQMAATRAQSSGVRCAILAAPGVTREHCLVLQRPLKLPNVVDVLNQAAAMTISSANVTGQGDDFYFRELEDFAHQADAQVRQPTPLVDVWGTLEAKTPVPRGGLHELIHGDPLEEPKPDPMSPTLAPDTTFEASGAPSVRSQSRGADKELALRGSSTAAQGLAPDALPPIKRALETDRHPLKSFLLDNLLGGPSALSAPGTVMLVIDPKLQCIHVEAGLEQLEPYCRDTVTRSAWRSLTSVELTQIRDSVPPRPYADLLWLDALLRSSGRLASHLDPGGSYRIKRRIETAPEFHRHGAIAAAMVEPARLNEIAAAGGAAMEQVFDVVNAYDAIGELEWTPRPRRHADSDAAQKSGSGIAAKLRWPFGKR